jgi:hypothetical protein
MSHQVGQHLPAVAADALHAALRSAVVEFARSASLEISAHDERLIREPARLPAGKTVYVAHAPRVWLEDIARVAAQAPAADFTAAPHRVARRPASVRGWPANWIGRAA